MRASKQVVDDAVLRIFIDLGARDGGRRLFEDLRLEWANTHLRSEDLVDGVRRLIFAGLLELEHTAEGPALMLSPHGRRRAAALSYVLQHSWNELLPTAAHAPTRSMPQARRRMSDSAAAG